MNKYKIYMIVGICVLSISILGSTVAFYVRELFNTGEQKSITYGLDYYINYAKGQNIEGVILNPSSSYEGSPSSDIEFWKIDDTYTIYGHLYMDVNSLGDSLSDSGALKYTVVNNNSIIAEGSITNNDEGTMLMAANIPLETNKKLFTIYVWLDDRLVPGSSINNDSLSLSVRCEATMKKIDYNTAAQYITNLYLNNRDKVVTNNNINYQYASSVGLMNDRLGGATEDYDAGNIRYYGANPNNYIDIGDRDSSGNIIPYRIIGVFKDMELEDGTKEDLIKVIRNESIGTYAYDNKDEGVGSSVTSSVYGSNYWADSRLMMLLNPGYDIYNESNPLLDNDGDIIYGYEGSLWWNSKSGTCYSPWKDCVNSSITGACVIHSVNTCDFTSTGLSNNVHEKIETVVWNFNSGSSNNGNLFEGSARYNYSNVLYGVERNGEIFISEYNGLEWPVEWIGKVALMYPSDYGYATDFNSCSVKLGDYDINGCYNNDWLNNNLNEFFVTAYSFSSRCFVNALKSSGSVDYAYASNDPLFVEDDGYYGVRPTFYLSSDLNILSGMGTIDNPYVIG